MRPERVVLPAPAISQGLGLIHCGEQLGVQEFIPEPAVVNSAERSSQDSPKPFCHGDPGSMYVVVVPPFSPQRLRAWAMN